MWTGSSMCRAPAAETARRPVRGASVLVLVVWVRTRSWGRPPPAVSTEEGAASTSRRWWTTWTGSSMCRAPAAET